MGTRNRLFILLIPVLAWTVGIASGQGGATSGAGARPVTVSMDLASTSFKVGDPVRFTLRTDQDAWVYIFSTDANGTTRQIFPNGYHRDNYLQAARTVSLPDSSYSLVASEPQGTATLSAFATTEKFEWLRSFDAGSGDAFPITRMAPAEFHARLDQSVREVARQNEAGRQSMPARSSITGGPPIPVQEVGYYHRPVPSFGFYSRSFSIIIAPPPPPPIVIHEPYPVYEPYPRYEPIYVPPPPVYVYPRPVVVYPRPHYYYYSSPRYGYHRPPSYYHRPPSHRPPSHDRPPSHRPPSNRPPHGRR